MEREQDRWTLSDMASAVQWARRRNDQGIRCILDILEGHARSPQQVDRSSLQYLDLATVIRREGLDASITVKPTTLGATYDRELCLKTAVDLAMRITRMGVGFELDMESRTLVDLTLKIAETCAKGGIPVTVALQAYLDRTHRDLERMIDAGVKVRLVKGAYSGDIADFDVITSVFQDLAEVLLERNLPWAAGTHDPELISWLKERATSRKDRFEFGFLMGLAERTKVALASEGRRVAEYVPYGTRKEGYDARRRTYLRKLEEFGRFPAP